MRDALAGGVPDAAPARAAGNGANAQWRIRNAAVKNICVRRVKLRIYTSRYTAVE